jgi:membrane protein
LSPRRIWLLTAKSLVAWRDDRAASMGGALAYYTLFSLAPVLIIAIAVAGFFLGEEAARGEILVQLRGLLGDDGAAAVQALLESAARPSQGVLATVFSIVLLVVGATTVFAELQMDLDRIFKAPEAKSRGGLFHLLRLRLLSFGLVLALGFLLLVSLVLSAALAMLGQWWGAYFEGTGKVLEAVNFLVSLTIATALFAVIYKVLPSISIAWRDVWIGAFVTAVLFAVGKTLIGLYIGRSGVASGFGAASSFVVVLIWVYYSTQVFLLGAEFTGVYARERGSRSAVASTADAA